MGAEQGDVENREMETRDRYWRRKAAIMEKATDEMHELEKERQRLYHN